MDLRVCQSLLTMMIYYATDATNVIYACQRTVYESFVPQSRECGSIVLKALRLFGPCINREGGRIARYKEKVILAHNTENIEVFSVHTSSMVASQTVSMGNFLGKDQISMSRPNAVYTCL